MALKYKPREFQEIVDSNDAARQYFEGHNPGVMKTYAILRDNFGGHCVRSRTALRLLWSDELKRSKNGFIESLRVWGYPTA